MKIFKFLTLILIFLATGCASQTDRKTSVYCKAEYLYSFDDDRLEQRAKGSKRILSAMPRGAKSGAKLLSRHFSHHLDVNLLKRQKKTATPEKEPEKVPEKKKKYTILIMSGGGQNGAFGAGILNGWSDRKEGVKRADIDMITTISTGAMALTYALVGNYGTSDQQRKADQALKNIYTKTSEDDLLEEKNVIAMLTTNSLVDTRGMGRTLDGAIAEFMPMIRAWPQDGSWAGKMAFAGVVNMDDGKFYVSDLLQVARDGARDGARDEEQELISENCYREVILASSAEPVFFPPRFITTDPSTSDAGHMYVDGGLRFGTFWHENLKLLEAHHLTVEVYVIVNGDLAVDPYVCNDSGECFRESKKIKNTVLDIAKRSSVIATDQLYKASLDKIYGDLMARYGAGKFKMNYTYIKPEYIRQKQCRKSLSSFDPAYMGCLYDIGEMVGRTWDWQDYADQK